MASGTWVNLARFVRRDIERTAKRGPTPDEVANQKRWAAEARMEAKRKAAELDDLELPVSAPELASSL